jgi:hypothetical protein
MKTTLINFYNSFFGCEFARYFRRPADFQISRIQYTVTTPQKLYLHVAKNSGFHQCFASIYDYCSLDQLKHNNLSNIYFDRIYFDFDISNSTLHNIKKTLVDLRSHGLKYRFSEQEELKLQLKDYVINGIAKPAIDDGKKFAYIFKQTFGKYPALFFSGFKGCHLYCFFEPTKLIDANKSIEVFSDKMKDVYNLNTMDLMVNKSALSRLARIPYSKHPYTGLSVIQFKISDSYEDIISKSMKPTVEPFNIGDHSTNFNMHLFKIDHILENNRLIKLEQNEARIKTNPKNYTPFDNVNHLRFFEDVLGEPEHKYPEKKYVMYHCPFKDHPDNNPSFRVYKTGYSCYGCEKSGNYWQFLKDYYGWDDNQVKHYLKSARTA